jgi:DNA-binding CsgD family transcriptional regulator
LNSFINVSPVCSDEEIKELTHVIWDRLADFDATQVDTALEYLLRGLCMIADAQNADWIGAVRLPEALPKEILQGWRPTAVHILHPTEPLVAAIRRESSNIETGFSDEVVANIIAQSGNFRACRLCDLVPDDWFQSEFYHRYYLDSGRGDVIYVAFPINDDAESYFGIFRDVGQPPFEPRERDAVAYVLRGIKWFHRHLMLSHGLLVAESQLTPVERRVLKQLLGGLTEKQIASALGQSYHTTHEHVTVIYRKFGVGNRASLMALWLGRGP